VKFLSEEVCLVSQENFSAFDLSKVESLCLSFISCGHDRITERCHVLSEFLCVTDDLVENLFFVGLEGQPRNFILPLLEIFQLWTGSVSRYSYSPVADRTSVLFIVLDFTSSDLETLSVIPNGLLRHNFKLINDVTYHS
jgi:hypothetical protein